ncbi:phostensin [Pelodytes ibericus]
MMEVPDWKVHLLERRRKDEEEMKKKDREEEDRLAKMPTWKREIILRRKAKASLLESRVEMEGGEQEEKEKVDVGDQEEREARVVKENIGPVQQNPFIQQEKQRKPAELSCTRPKPTPESPVVCTVRADEAVRDSHLPNEEAEKGNATNESPPSCTEERKGRVSRLLCRFGRSMSENESGGTVVARVNGEGDGTCKALCPALLTVEPDVQASASLTQPAPPSPSCPRPAMGNQTLTQETTLSPLNPLSSSPSCTASEPAVHAPCASLSAMSGLNARPSMPEEARPFPFHLRSASPASPRQLRQTVQSSPSPPRPEPSKLSTARTDKEAEGGPALPRVPFFLSGTKIGLAGENQALQKRKGNTITVNPRKTAVCENGFVPSETKAPAAKNDSGKKRYPTADEIKVIGGYQALSKSCLAKHSQDKKKLNISFPDSELESTFEYPSEGSLLAEFGPPDESEAMVAPPQAEDDEEEESVLLGGIMRRKALIVDESCKR